MGGEHGLRRVNAVAARQYELITREQLLAAGVTRRQIDRLVAAGWLTRVHTGVYAIGPPRRDPPARWMAATLATGGVLSHRSAAEQWDLLPVRGGPVEVTVRSHGSRRAGIVAHRGAGETTRRRGIPCTTLVRTLCDLAAIVDAKTLARAFEQAQVLHHLSPAILGAALSERLGARGTRKLARLVAQAVEPGEVESVLEIRFLRFCGGRFHATAAARARDTEKQAHIESLGWRVLRVRWRELHDDPGAVAARVRSAFSRIAGEDADLAA